MSCRRRVAQREGSCLCANQPPIIAQTPGTTCNLILHAPPTLAAERSSGASAAADSNRCAPPLATLLRTPAPATAVHPALPSCPAHVLALLLSYRLACPPSMPHVSCLMGTCANHAPPSLRAVAGQRHRRRHHQQQHPAGGAGGGEAGAGRSRHLSDPGRGMQGPRGRNRAGERGREGEWCWLQCVVRADCLAAKTR